jgi:septal ring factor EnvC (AmiA/AmiB activator)
MRNALALVLLMQVAAHASQPAPPLVEEYDRRARIVGGEWAKRRTHLQQRLLALYKLQRGGYARLLAESTSRPDLFRRRAAAAHIVERDLAELAAYARERNAIVVERARLAGTAPQDGAPRAAPILLRRPLAPGPIVASFGAYKDPQLGLEFTRRGVLLGGHEGDVVRAPADGIVRVAAPVADLGDTVVIEHDGGLFTVLGRLRDLRVATGAHVSASDPIATAAASRVLLEVRQGTTPLDPATLLGHTGGK